MPNPTHSDLHVSAALTDMSTLFSNEDSQSVHDKVFPVMPVNHKSDEYFEYDKGDWLRTDARRRAPGAEAAVSGWRLTTSTYNCERFAIAHDVSDPERANADPAVADLDADAVRFVTEDLRIRHEKDWVTSYFSTGVWSGGSSTVGLTGVSASPSTATEFLQWNDDASTPIEDLRGEMTSGQSKTAKKFNTLVLGAQVWSVLQDHPDMLDRIKFSERGIVGTDLLASLLDIDNVWISTMVEDTSIELAAESVNFSAGKNVLLAHVPSSPGLRVQSAGYTFSWTGMPGAPTSGVGARIKRFRLERNESDRIEGEAWKDFKVVSADLGIFLASAVV